MYVEINMDIECFGGQKKKLICNRVFRRKNLVIEMVKMPGGWVAGRLKKGYPFCMDNFSYRIQGTMYLVFSSSELF